MLLEMLAMEAFDGAVNSRLFSYPKYWGKRARILAKNGQERAF